MNVLLWQKLGTQILQLQLCSGVACDVVRRPGYAVLNKTHMVVFATHSDMILADASLVTL